MSDRGLEFWLAKLATSKRQRALFIGDRSMFCESNEIDDALKFELQKVDAMQLEVFAQGLINKRWGVIRAFFPLSMVNEKGAILRKAFERYAAENSVKGMHKKHLNDALGFAKYFLSSGIDDQLLRNAMRYDLFNIKLDHLIGRFHFQYSDLRMVKPFHKSVLACFFIIRKKRFGFRVLF